MKPAQYVEMPTCGTRRGPRSNTCCELPPDHVTGRATGRPVLELYHFGRSLSGRWFSWPLWRKSS